MPHVVLSSLFFVYLIINVLYHLANLLWSKSYCRLPKDVFLAKTGEKGDDI
jgi:hypothetical protein